MRRIIALILIPLVLSACAQTGLRNLSSTSDGPDEFAVAPVGALVAPDNYSELPTPTPGQSNLTDRSAVNEGAVAVGGTIQDPNAPIPASESALVNHASRLGVQGNIRENLATEDATFRKRKRRFTQIRIVAVDRYNQAYKKQTLEPRAEESRWRRAGIATPSAQPDVRRR